MSASTDVRLLATLHVIGGGSAGRIASAMGYDNPRKASPLILGDLLRMERAGLVNRIDGSVPVAWVRTAVGTAAMENCHE